MSNKDIIRLAVTRGIKRVALGNSNRGLKEVACDLLHEFGNSPKAKKQLADMTFLSPATIDRLMDNSDKGFDHYHPLSDTLERVFKATGCEVSFSDVEIKAQYMNKPKTESDLVNATYDDAEMAIPVTAKAS